MFIIKIRDKFKFRSLTFNFAISQTFYHENDKDVTRSFDNRLARKNDDKHFTRKLLASTKWMVEINSSQDVRDCMNATMPCRCEFHAEATIAAARDGGGTKESAARGIGFRRARGQAARDVCSKQFQLTCWNWNRTRIRSPGRLSARGCHGAEDNEDMSIPSSIHRASSFFFVKFRRYAMHSN